MQAAQQVEASRLAANPEVVSGVEGIIAAATAGRDKIIADQKAEMQKMKDFSYERDKLMEKYERLIRASEELYGEETETTWVTMRLSDWRYRQFLDAVIDFLKEEIHDVELLEAKSKSEEYQIVIIRMIRYCCGPAMEHFRGLLTSGYLTYDL